jgi:hypothetical protein
MVERGFQKEFWAGLDLCFAAPHALLQLCVMQNAPSLKHCTPTTRQKKFRRVSGNNEPRGVRELHSGITLLKQPAQPQTLTGLKQAAATQRIARSLD